MSYQGKAHPFRYRSIAPRLAPQPQLSPEPQSAFTPQLPALDKQPCPSKQPCGGERCVFETALEVFGVQPEPDKHAGDVEPLTARRAGEGFFSQPDAAWRTPARMSLNHPIGPRGQRQKSDENVLCAACNEIYVVARNHENSCVRHKFKKPVCNYSSPMWATWNENVNGPKDTPYNRQYFSKGFRWPCCGRPGLANGCTSDFHRPQEEVAEEANSSPRSRHAVGRAAAHGTLYEDAMDLETAL